MHSSLCFFSGGYDSVAATVLESQAMEKAISEPSSPNRLFLLFVDYGQVYAEREWEAAKKASQRIIAIAPSVQVELLKVKIEGLVITQTRGAVGEYIPMRNFTLFGIAANIAEGHDCSRIVTGNKTGLFRPDDPYCFRDCTLNFQRKVEQAVQEAWPLVNLPTICSPLSFNPATRQAYTKADVLELLIRFGFTLSELTSCYAPDGQVSPCWNCFHCGEVEAALSELTKKGIYSPPDD